MLKLKLRRHKQPTSATGHILYPVRAFGARGDKVPLKDNVTIYLDHGATILAAKTIAPGKVEGSYDAADPNPNMAWDHYADFGHNHWHNSLIWGEGLKNVLILGPGLIWGKGLSRGGKHDVPRAEDPGIGNGLPFNLYQ